MESKKLGKNIKLAQIEHDMNQVDLAEVVGTLLKSVFSDETGASLPSLETIEKISKDTKEAFWVFFGRIERNMIAYLLI